MYQTWEDTMPVFILSKLDNSKDINTVNIIYNCPIVYQLNIFIQKIEEYKASVSRFFALQYSFWHLLSVL